MCLTEMYGAVQVGKNLSDMFPTRNGLKEGDALSPLLFNCALEYSITRLERVCSQTQLCQLRHHVYIV